MLFDGKKGKGIRQSSANANINRYDLNHTWDTINSTLLQSNAEHKQAKILFFWHLVTLLSK